MFGEIFLSILKGLYLESAVAHVEVEPAFRLRSVIEDDSGL